MAPFLIIAGWITIRLHLCPWAFFATTHFSRRCKLFERGGIALYFGFKFHRVRGKTLLHSTMANDTLSCTKSANLRCSCSSGYLHRNSSSIFCSSVPSAGNFSSTSSSTAPEMTVTTLASSSTKRTTISTVTMSPVASKTSVSQNTIIMAVVVPALVILLLCGMVFGIYKYRNKVRQARLLATGNKGQLAALVTQVKSISFTNRCQMWSYVHFFIYFFSFFHLIRLMIYFLYNMPLYSAVLKRV